MGEDTLFSHPCSNSDLVPTITYSHSVAAIRRKSGIAKKMSRQFCEVIACKEMLRRWDRVSKRHETLPSLVPCELRGENVSTTCAHCALLVQKADVFFTLASVKEKGRNLGVSRYGFHASAQGGKRKASLEHHSPSAHFFSRLL